MKNSINTEFKSYLLVDLSYLTFYRFYATKIWYSKQNNCNLEGKWIENNNYMEKFKKLYCEKIFKIMKKYKIEKKNIIMCKDCHRKNIWRKELLNSYKENRSKIYTNDWCEKIGTLFNFVHNKFIYELSKKHKFNILEYDKLEGDDLISITTNYLKKKYKNIKIIIISNDYDLLQLISNNVIIINLKNKILNDKSLGSTEMDNKYKSLFGDKVDNIPGVFPRCGKKTCLKLINNNLLLEKYFKKYENSQDKYELNKKLIDFAYIPDELKAFVIKKLDLMII